MTDESAPPAETADLEASNARSVYFRDGKPTLIDSFVAYIDELGTRHRIATLTDDSLVNDRNTALEFDAFLHREEWQGRSQRYATFTDNVVLGAPADSFSTARQLRFMLTSIAHYQLGLTLRSRLVRGGVCRGPLFVDDRLITGQALVDAVELEEQEAVFPRVLINTECYESIKSDGVHDNLKSGGGMDWASIILIDGDGRLFLNYLLANTMVDVPAEVQERLDRHRGVINAGLKNRSLSPRAHSKYLWMADYQDYVFSTYFADLGVENPGGPRHRDHHRSFRQLSDLPLRHAASALMDAAKESPQDFS